MDSNTTYTKTARGLRALVKKLPRDAGHVLSVIDKGLTSPEIQAKLNNISEKDLEFAITWLLEGGFIKSLVVDPFPNSMWDVSTKSAMQVDEIGIDEFTVSEKLPEAEIKKRPVIKTDAEIKAEAEQKARIDAKKKALEQADSEARERAEAALKAKNDAEAQAISNKDIAATKERERLEAAAKAKAEAEANAKKEAEAKQKAEDKAAAEDKERLEKERKRKEKAEAKAKKAEEKAAAKEKARVEKEENAKIEAIAKAEKETKQKAEAEEAGKLKLEIEEKKQREALDRAEARAEAQIKHQRLMKNIRAKMPGKQWLISILKSIKPISIFAIGVVFLLIIAAQFINMSILINPVEKIATNNIQDNVNIKSINVSLFPRPHLLLKGITIADSTTVNIQKMRVYPDITNLKEKLFNASTSPYEIKSISIDGLNIAQKDIPSISTWSGASSRNQQLKINKIELTKLSINLNVIQLPYIDGDITLDDAGQLQEAAFTTEDKGLNVAINLVGNDYLISIEALRWRAPLSPYPIFTKLNAKGGINNHVLTLTSIKSDLYNGDLTAGLQMNLNSPSLASKGEFTINNVYLGAMAKELNLDTVVDGKLNINGNYAFNINKPLNSINMTELNSSFDIKNGQLRKVDLAEAMRSGNLNGSTDFTKLSGEITLKNQVYRFNNLSLRDNQLQATGQVSITSNQHVSGVVSSSIALKRNTIRSRLVIDGPLTALKLKN